MSLPPSSNIAWAVAAVQLIAAACSNSHRPLARAYSTTGGIPTAEPAETVSSATPDLRVPLDPDSLVRLVMELPLGSDLGEWRGRRPDAVCRFPRKRATGLTWGDGPGVVGCVASDSILHEEYGFDLHEGHCCTLQSARLAFVSPAGGPQLREELARNLGTPRPPPPWPGRSGADLIDRAPDSIPEEYIFGLLRIYAVASWRWRGHDVALIDCGQAEGQEDASFHPWRNCEPEGIGELGKAPALVALFRVDIEQGESVAKRRRRFRDRMAASPVSELREPDRSIEAHIASAIADVLPDYPSLRTSDDRDGIYRGLAALLRTASSETSSVQSKERQVALFLAADRLATNLLMGVGPTVQDQHADQARVRDLLAGHSSLLRRAGVPRLGGSERRGFNNDILLWAMTDPAAGFWRDDAFLILQDRGWSLRPNCLDGPDEFRRVIPAGEAFLQRPLDPFHRRETFYALAVAYETWWSLSLASDDSYVMPERCMSGAIAARQRALGYYQVFLQSEPDGPRRRLVEDRLETLRLGLDTGQRRFHCVNRPII